MEREHPITSSIKIYIYIISYQKKKKEKILPHQEKNLWNPSIKNQILYIFTPKRKRKNNSYYEFLHLQLCMYIYIVQIRWFASF